jgi:hunchback-like protein
MDGQGGDEYSNGANSSGGGNGSGSGGHNLGLGNNSGISSSHKSRKQRCKNCPFVATNKDDFWRHTTEHIKPEKQLNCPQCPFVTEFKHHLEYHLRNHLGSKPFKCEKCNYTCVNKSMLNS